MHRLLALGFITTLSANAETINLIQNGNFEDGLAGWTVVTSVYQTAPACGMPFTLQTTGSSSCGSSLPDPVGGGSAVYNSAQYNVGSSSGEFETAIIQIVDVPDVVTSATLTWQSTWAVQFTGSSIPVEVGFISLGDPNPTYYNVTCGVPLFGPTSSAPWTNLTCGINILPILVAHEGQQLQISLITNPFIDPSSNILGVTASMGFDNVALVIDTPVPEPATLPTVASVLAFSFLCVRRKHQR